MEETNRRGTPTMLSPAQVEQFARDGFVFPVSVFSPAEAAAWARDVVALSTADLGGHGVPWHQKSYLLLPSLDELLRDPRLTDPVADILGPDLLALSADVFLKPAHSTRRITWHQDVNYWQLDPFDMLTAWVALTPAMPDNGGMQYARGGHLGRIPHVERPDEENILSKGQELAVSVAEADVSDVTLAAGEVSFHHALTPHASGPNLTGAARIGFAIRYAATTVRQTGGPPITARSARGADAHGHFALEDGPVRRLDPEALAAHRLALAPHEATGFSTV